jgi:uncharacterized protein with HEPN domain
MESTLKEEILDRLSQIVESIDVVSERCAGKELDDLLSSPWGMTVLDACVMRLQVIGETIKAIDEKTHKELFSNYPEIPWRKIVGLRNIISHEYANIDYEIIWSVIQKSLPELRTTIVKIGESLQSR